MYDELALLSFYRFTHCTKLPRGTPFHVPPRRRGIIITTFHDFGTNCMVPQDWDSAPRCICGPNFLSDLIGESPIFSAARNHDFFGGLFSFGGTAHGTPVCTLWSKIPIGVATTGCGEWGDAHPFARSGRSFLDSYQFSTLVEPFTPVMRDTPSP